MELLFSKILIGIVIITSSVTAYQKTNWEAPEEADKIRNPYKDNETVSETGESLYQQQCWSCHGEKGKGNGPAAVSLDPQPADFSNENVQKQTDGALYWKISEGRGSMPAFKHSLSEKQRWGLVNHIRSFQ